MVFCWLNVGGCVYKFMAKTLNLLQEKIHFLFVGFFLFIILKQLNRNIYFTIFSLELAEWRSKCRRMILAKKNLFV